jgi:membrane fusion protein, heavy metal efflux system
MSKKQTVLLLLVVLLIGTLGFTYSRYVSRASLATTDVAEADANPPVDANAPLKLSDTALKNLSVSLETVGVATLQHNLSLPGQIAVDEHRMKAVTSRFGGVIIQMPKHAGQAVKQGELLAILESRELADLKLDYVQQQEQQQQSDRLVQQQRQIRDGVKRLIQLLRNKANFQSIQAEALKLNLGTPKTTLLGDYTRLKNAAENLRRETQLYKDQLSSQQEFLQAKQNYEAAQSSYMGALEEVDRTEENLLYEHELAANLTRNSSRTAAAKLTGMGISVASLSKTANALNRYEIYAPMSGTLIEKKVSEGENIGAETTLYKIADLSEVWAETNIYESDIPQIKVGTPVTIYAENQAYSTPGKLMHLKPLVNEETRTAEAHAEIANPKGVWFPGMFITLKVHQKQKFVPLAIYKSAVQTLNNTLGVFVKTPDGFIFKPITPGMEGDDKVEVLAGLKAGEIYAANNSFILKSEFMGKAGN